MAAAAANAVSPLLFLRRAGRSVKRRPTAPPRLLICVTQNVSRKRTSAQKFSGNQRLNRFVGDFVEGGKHESGLESN